MNIDLIASLPAPVAAAAATGAPHGCRSRQQAAIRCRADRHMLRLVPSMNVVTP